MKVRGTIKSLIEVAIRLLIKDREKVWVKYVDIEMWLAIATTAWLIGKSKVKIKKLKIFFNPRSFINSKVYLVRTLRPETFQYCLNIVFARSLLFRHDWPVVRIRISLLYTSEWSEWRHDSESVEQRFGGSHQGYPRAHWQMGYGTSLSDGGSKTILKLSLLI